jgi:hypothetical protein
MSGLGLTFLRRGGQAHPTAGSDYIKFKDEAVFNVLMSNGVSSDGVGITKDDALSIKTIGTWFQKNKAVTNFDELFRFFTNISSLNEYAFNECSSLQFNGIESPNITTIGQWAFRYCTPTNGAIVLPNLTSLGNQAFAYTGVEEVLDLGKITRLSANQWGTGVFRSCTQLRKVILPSSLTAIGFDPFAGCKSIEVIVCYAEVPPTLGHQMALQSSDTNGCPIYVPDGSVAAYKAAANWSNHAARIKGISEYQG